MTTINFIGAGNLGKTIGRLLVINKIGTIVGICNQSEESTRKAIDFIGAGHYYSDVSALPNADLTLITTPDDVIGRVCKEYSNNPFIKEGNIVIHCSGSLGSDILFSVKKKGVLTASIHPMRSFANPEYSAMHYRGTFCALEGDAEALNIIQPIFDAIGSTTYLIDASNKSSYHAAGVFASNYLVTLSLQALHCMTFSGVEEPLAMQIITNIMSGTISNLQTTLSPHQSLTGPIQRGDITSIQSHMAHLPNQKLRRLYSILGEATLELTDHDEDKKKVIREVLSDLD